MLEVLVKELYLKYKKHVYTRFWNKRGFTRVMLIMEKFLWRSIDSIEREPDNIFDEEWDNLIIVDACRQDIYEDSTGVSDYRYSKGSTTGEYIERNFSEGEFDNIVYIAGNPFLADEFLDKFTGRKNIFCDKFDTFQTDWSEEDGTVLPEPLVRDAKTAESLYPDKRKIIHFIQPHHPFVNADYDSGKYERKENWLTGFEFNVWDQAEVGLIDHETVSQDYQENLDYVLPHVEKLAEELEGKTVVTSDHGNLLGEMGLYGHPPENDLKPLRKVPWHVISE